MFRALSKMSFPRLSFPAPVMFGVIVSMIPITAPIVAGALTTIAIYTGLTFCISESGEPTSV